MATIPTSFISKKEKILKDLSVPEEDYTDLSPKGSVDVAIIPLIRDINRLPGLVTTSSCAGRISVFVERGKLGKARADNDTIATEKAPEDPEDGSLEDKLGHDKRLTAEYENKFVPRGGKGSGTWQFVSHDPLLADGVNTEKSFHELFGLKPSGTSMSLCRKGEIQLIKFKFEPMILHIMAASLSHAQPVLAAASNAGFRESGIQGLRCLEDADACPIVAVRSSGLGLESIIGYIEDDRSLEPSARSVVTEEYLQLLVQISNERFKVNTERTERFRMKLLHLVRGQNPDSLKPQWEDPKIRRERKRAEGLERSKAARKAEKVENATSETHDEDMIFGVHALGLS
ncbi:DUF207 domain-containing protein [Nannizzia gypsea CBS 118893]|uniref:tRNA(Phe) 7-[(3-amino-3-carboxypropyl)-4-demethylwyosine(37)-N(4)]-methyltransferase n=1 Tax=Arthroderma gypseum (strain ATCC MYA-4604 / CBS 118893) TaxID=535722 RepID=E5R0L7_ARTGP|nr:DUF207 domain-containing protein [Nannizzia gypsea CBS 118893]EFQ98361.1 DUF207 domain-containing protein [Nannizzia gypsea CBS 118893]